MRYCGSSCIATVAGVVAWAVKYNNTIPRFVYKIAFGQASNGTSYSIYV